MRKNYVFLCDGNDAGVQEVVRAAGFYSVGFINEFSWGITGRHKIGAPGYELPVEEQQRRRNMIEFAIGPIVTGHIMNHQRLALDEFITVVQDGYIRLDAFTDSPQISVLSKDDQLWLEDMEFYLGEALRGIEGACKMADTVVYDGDGCERPLMEYKELEFCLADSLGICIKDKVQKFADAINEWAQARIDEIEYTCELNDDEHGRIYLAHEKLELAQKYINSWERGQEKYM